MELKKNFYIFSLLYFNFHTVIILGMHPNGYIIMEGVRIFGSF